MNSLLGNMEIMFDSLHEKCRLCLSVGDGMQDLFASGGNQVLLEKISDSLSIMITDFENLPTKVCSNCCTQVDKVYNFKKKCLAIDNLLRNHVKHKHKERSQSTLEEINVGSEPEYISIPSTSTGMMDFDPELLKVEIKEEEDDETSRGSICTVNDDDNDLQFPFKSQQKLKQGTCSTKRKKKLKTRLGNPVYKCLSCGKNFCNKYSLSRHKWSHSKKTFSCTVCDKILTNHESWLRHEKMHESGNRYKCEMCDKSYVSSTSYTAHVRKHTGERPYKCSECEEKFYLVSSFERHVAKHRGMKEFKCEICSAAFWVPDDLRAHVNRMH